MLKHIVTWKMNGETAADRAQQAGEVAAALRGMEGKIPQIEHLEVHVNELDGYDNWDVALITEFADADALAEYVVHPAHQEVVHVVKARAAGRAGVDATV